MLLRLITVISLILFMLLMISGVNIDVALYRSMLAFMVLFAVVYLAIFMLNVLRQDNKPKHATASHSRNSKAEGENK
ncbi:MAG: hypothetical protein FH748_00720 [Balneolaceae bacterium]|nr:hypothetical protein [Balneolaceae bacterium]